MKKFLPIYLAAILLLFTFPPAAQSYMVDIVFDNVRSKGIDVSGFELYFYDPAVNASYGWPPTSDFNWAWGPGVNDLNWRIDEINTSDFTKVRGIAPLDDIFDPASPLFDGLVLRLATVTPKFGINPLDTHNVFFDYSGNFGNLIQEIRLSESWVGDKQIITVSVIPIPSTAILLGCGLIMLVVLRRRRG